MLINADKAVKTSLLQMYKKEAEDFIKNKKAVREKKIKEEREYLQQITKQETALDDKYRLDQLHRMQKKVECNNENSLHEHPHRRYKSRIEDVRINNYGHNISGSCSSPIYSNMRYRDKYRDRGGKPYQMHLNNSLLDIKTDQQKEIRDIDMVIKDSHMADYLTDIPNENQLKEYFNKRKNNRSNYYRNVLDAQCSQMEKITSIPSCAYIRNPVIIQQYKKYQLAQDPYSRRRIKDIGLSNLERNIIVNPEDHLNYNKYFNFEKRPRQGQGSDIVIHNWNNYDFEEKNRGNESMSQREDGNKSEFFKYAYSCLPKKENNNYYVDKENRHDKEYNNYKGSNSVQNKNSNHYNFSLFNQGINYYNGNNSQYYNQQN